MGYAGCSPSPAGREEKIKTPQNWDSIVIGSRDAPQFGRLVVRDSKFQKRQHKLGWYPYLRKLLWLWSQARSQPWAKLIMVGCTLITLIRKVHRGERQNP